MDPLIQVLLTLVVGLGGAYLGAKWGAEQGLQKFKSERAFEDRLDWYARMIRTLTSAKASLRNATLGGTVTLSSAQLDAINAVNNVALEGYLFASSDGIRMLMHLQLYIEEARATGGTTKGAAGLEEVASVYSRTARQLALDGREHLGLEELEIGSGMSPKARSAIEAIWGKRLADWLQKKGAGKVPGDRPAAEIEGAAE